MADETGLGKSMVARGVIAKAIERLDQGDSGVDRIDVVYVCSNADLAKQNLSRLNVTGQKDIIESGRLTLLPTELAKLNAPAAPGTRKRVNFISLTPGTSFNVGGATGQARERAVLFRILAQLGVINEEQHSDAVELLRAGSSTGRFARRVQYMHEQFPGGFSVPVRNRFRTIAHQSGNLPAFRKALREASRDGANAVRPRMSAIIGGLRGDLAQAGLDCLEPDLIILDEFQRFRDLLYSPGTAPSDEDPAAELARQFLNYKGAKLILLSATPYKAHTAANDADGDDHAADFRQLLRFLSSERSGYMESLEADLDDRRTQLLKQVPDEALTERIEDQLRLFMARTERPQLGKDDMLSVIEMAPTDVRATDLASYKSLSALFRATRTGNPMEYWKSVPMFAHFLTDYKVGRMLDGRIQCDREAVDPVLPVLTTIDADAYRRYGAVETDNAKFRAVRDHTVGQGWWKLLWMPPSLPYVEPSGAFAEVGMAVTKQLVFSAWNAAPTAITTLLSYEAERQILEGSPLHGENTADARKRFRGRLRFRVREGEPQAMSTLALFIPHAALALVGDPLQAAAMNGSLAAANAVREAAAVAGSALVGSASVEPSNRLGAWASYFSVPGALPAEWANDLKLAANELRAVDEFSQQQGKASDDGGTDHEGGSEAGLYLAHLDRMLEAISADPTWEEGVQDLAVNSPANCMYRALRRIVPDDFDGAELWKAAVFAATGLRTLFNRLDVTELLDKLYPEGDYWQKVLRYCEGGNLQAVLDEYVFQLRSQQGPETIDKEQLWALAGDIRRALSLKPAQMLAKYPDESHEDLRMGVRFAVRYSNSKTEDGDSNRMPEVRRAFNSPFWPFVLASTSVGQEGIDFHWWAHSVIHWNVPRNPVDFEQREGRVHRYLGHAVRKNVAAAHGAAVLKPGMSDPWRTLFEVASADIAAQPESSSTEFAPHWIHPGAHKIERRLLDHPLSRDVPRTKHMLNGLAKYRLTLGQARQDDLLGLIKDGAELKPLNLRP
ncbi:helicase C-terminal domain-containing protein [Arthrobacter sp. AB6]|uniref:helicase C-terminal domain-containing protein n=1 Tax=Arthrobacter sp. AB6 TaxID=2962570 RepID=UPI0028822B21|nr:helicase C-terminal domain-containing protein [Arthrobacter sp. AB6]MDT0195702.1 helicase C-terminal domain-containing protein [Arthrobacter sp. AB6]